MKANFLIASCLLVLSFRAHAQSNALDTTTYTGVYQGANLLFQNVSFQNDFSKDFISCIYAIQVNGKPVTDKITDKTVEIAFTKLTLKKGDPVVVKVIHFKNCTFKCLNEKVLHEQLNNKTTK